jgi:hypothetical protein
VSCPKKRCGYGGLNVEFTSCAGRVDTTATEQPVEDVGGLIGPRFRS